MSDTQLIDLFVTALHTNPAADPPPGLDPATARAIRAAVLAGRRDPPDAAAKSRVWKTALDAALSESTPPDTSRPTFSANGSHKEDPNMTSLSISRPSTATLRLRSMALMAAAVTVLLFASVLMFQAMRTETSGPVVSYLSTEEANMVLFERYINEAWNTGDEAVFDELLTDNHVYHDADAGDLVGLEALVDHIETFRETYPDAEFTITSIGAADNRVWARISMSGTDGVPREIMFLVHFDDGQIVEQWAQQVTPSGNIIVGPGCTLVDAINTANGREAVGNCEVGQRISTDVIELTADVVLLESDNNTDGLNGLPSIVSDIEIQGNGYTIARDENAEDFRIFHIAEEGNLTLQDMTISHGTESAVLNQGKLVVHRVTFSGNSTSNSGGAIENESSGNVFVTFSTFTNNSAAWGGAIHNDSGVLTVDYSRFSNNSAREGGAIFNREGVLTVHESDVSSNTAREDGGGIRVLDSPYTLFARSTINSNKSGQWTGGLSVEGSTWMLVDSVVSGNVGTCAGGGIYSAAGSHAEIIRTVVSENEGKGDCRIEYSGFVGGLTNTIDSTMMLVDSTVANNRSSYATGGISNSNNSTLTITGSTVTGNSSARAAGINNLNDSALTLINSTVCDNTASETMGGIGNNFATLIVTNSTICNNTAPAGGGIGWGYDMGQSFDVVYARPGDNNAITLNNTIVANNDGGDCVAGDDAGTYLGAANLDTDGSCPGSAVLTGFEDGQVVAGSNAIDAGDPDFCPETDQHGAPRDEACDIGAVEFGVTIEE